MSEKQQGCTRIHSGVERLGLIISRGGEKIPIIDIFSKRKKKEETPFVFDQIPERLRNQIVHIWIDAIGPYGSGGSGFAETSLPSNYYWGQIAKMLCREYGVFTLTESHHNAEEQCFGFINGGSVEEVLDIVEISFRIIDRVIRNLSSQKKESMQIQQEADEAISELNTRFREHNVGYQYVEGYIQRVDSECMYREVTIPAVKVLKNKKYEGALEEFLNAHNKLKKGEYKEAIREANNAFESAMKSICNDNNWEVKGTPAAKRLIEICFDKGLVDPSLASQFNALRSTLESGLPTVRNMYGGHGQGDQRVDVPAYLARYALNLAGSNIILLIEANEGKKR